MLHFSNIKMEKFWPFFNLLRFWFENVIVETHGIGTMVGISPIAGSIHLHKHTFDQNGQQTILTTENSTTQITCRQQYQTRKRPHFEFKNDDLLK